MTLTAAWWVQLLVSIGIIVDSFERLASARDYGDNGILSPKVLQSVAPSRWHAVRVARRVAHMPHILTSVLVARIGLLGIAILPGAEPELRAGLLAAVFAANIFLAPRNLFGGDGSDQMDYVIIAGLIATYVLASRGQEWLGLAFITAQSLLSYAVAGIAKLCSPVWRRGQAVPWILATATYGSVSIARALAARPTLGVVASRGVIALECLFPLALAVPFVGLIAFLIAGALMHLSIAVTMGLNKFLLSWLATYPAIIICHELLPRLQGVP